MSNTLLVNEIFHSIQGEGPSVGTPALFIRLFGCPLSCWFCDSAFAWRTSEKQKHREDKVYSKAEESKEYTVEGLIQEVGGYPEVLLQVITGGEPLLQRKPLLEYLSELYNRYWLPQSYLRFEIETAGILEPLWEFQRRDGDWITYNVSPKLETSGNSLSSRYKPKLLKKFLNERRSIFKFVVVDDSDLKEINMIIREIGIPPQLVYLMAEGETRQKQLTNMEKVVSHCLENNYNFSPRLHTLIWGNERGK
jgi:7-carboxy-7-deazaguanine synthase